MIHPPATLLPLALRWAARRVAPLQGRGTARRFAAAAELARSPSKASLSAWDPSSLQSLLQQVAQEGKLEEALSQRLRGVAAAAAAKKEEKEEEEEEEEGGAEDESVGTSSLVKCERDDLLLTAEVCSAQKLKDYVLLSALGQRLLPEVEKAPKEMLLRTGSAFASLGVLHPELFQALAKGWLHLWNGDAAPESIGELAEVASSFSKQRVRHEELLDKLGERLELAGGASKATPQEALSLMHSFAFLRLSSSLGETWKELEKKVMDQGLGKLSLPELSELCYIFVLSRESDSRQDELCEMLKVLAGHVLNASPEYWKSPEGATVHKRVMLLRSVMRYMYKDAYKTQVPDSVVHAFRKLHRMERPNTTIKPAVNFTRKLSTILRKMRIGHIVNAEAGPFTFDIVERDRKLVYECLHFDRYYAGTIEKIETMCLQERVVKAMGYRIVSIPHWQWNKIKHRRQRAEYLRMSRYYAIKDNRELMPRDDVPFDTALNPFDFMGEFFFKKERPSSAWSWFQPRYDYRRRLPGAAALESESAKPQNLSA
mmetsp:Transcript_19126/g.41215  ORF Transcript_19126/g.41215 Transcript_19126/m.41215 type:complete len:542 (-) Transcript_19126:165-1790(-)